MSRLTCNYLHSEVPPALRSLLYSVLCHQTFVQVELTVYVDMEHTRGRHPEEDYTESFMFVTGCKGSPSQAVLPSTAGRCSIMGYRKPLYQQLTDYHKRLWKIRRTASLVARAAIRCISDVSRVVQ